MAALSSAPRIWSFPISNSAERNNKRPQSRCHPAIGSEKTSSNRRFIVGGAAVSVLTYLNSSCKLLLSPTRAEESKDEEEGIIGTLKSLFDPSETTKTGKVLPKAYLKSVREVVKTLRESLNEDPNDMAKFRRTADAAKDSIRDYLNGWRGEKAILEEKSYVMLEKAIRSLANFYSKAGPSAALPEDVKSEILRDLTTAEESL
ncbi:hypothetical protein CASFOL_005365 [Castilleja foliolosa]|uniref:Uncharacterized protein n=1 Tax=Castilleja foliolosa TaxID=1961234 RepID=A0ABD3E4G9_9LAMI